MKILFYIDQTYAHGGIEKILADKANYFDEHYNFEVIIATFEQQNRKPCYSINKNVKQVDLEINYARDKSYYSLGNLLKLPKHILRTSRLLKKEKPDILINCSSGFEFYFIPFINKKVKKIKEFHSSRFGKDSRHSNKKGILKSLTNWIEKKYDRIIVLSNEEAKFYASKNVEIIPNSVIQNVKKAFLEKPNVISAGRLAPVKGFDNLIEAWRFVHKKFPLSELHIYGQDYLNTQKCLQSLIEKYELTETVKLKGAHENIVGCMSDYSVYAMSSKSECFPIVLLEASAVGLPIVSYDCPTGPRNIITNEENGILVENQNPNALAAGIIKLLKSRTLRSKIGEKAIQNSQEYSELIVMEKWRNCFQELLKVK